MRTRWGAVLVSLPVRCWSDARPGYGQPVDEQLCRYRQQHRWGDAELTEHAAGRDLLEATNPVSPGKEQSMVIFRGNNAGAAVTRRDTLKFLGIGTVGGVVLPSLSASSTARTASPQRAIHAWVPTSQFSSSSFVRVDRQTPDPIPAQPAEPLTLSAVRGEHVSAQLAVAGGSDGLERLHTQVGPLIGEDDSRRALPPIDVQVRYPQYIPDGHGGVIADPLRRIGAVDVPAGKTQPIWFTVNVPAYARPGTYESHITLSAAHGKRIQYDLTLNVTNVTLPPVTQRSFDLNVWFEPDSVADQLGLQLWSDAHFAALRPYLTDLAAHGQRVINTAVADDPWPRILPDGTWRAQTYVPWHSLVKWYYDGSRWSFDFTNWDRYVEESLAAGVGPRISAFGLVGFKGNNHLVYTDTRTNTEVDQKLTLGGPEWTSAWSAFLSSFETHLRHRGWLAQTHMAFDERPTNEMQTAFDLVKRVAPDLAGQQFAIAGDQSADAFAYDLSLNYSSVDSWPQDVINRRKQEGKVTTFYTWNEPLYPNTLTQSPPIGARLLPWISAQHNLNGYLRWSYNSWPADPYTDPSFMAKTFSSSYQPGDEYLVYPGKNGPVSSIRWELFRDGEEDFALLNELAQRGGADNPVRRRSLSEVDPSITPGPSFYQQFLKARAAVVQELERLGPRPGFA
jgi:hypothetical protein